MKAIIGTLLLVFGVAGCAPSVSADFEVVKEYIQDILPSEVTNLENIALPTGVTTIPKLNENTLVSIEWSSSHPDVISGTGAILAIDGFVGEVTLTAFISIRNKIETKTYIIYVNLPDHYTIVHNQLIELLPTAVYGSLQLNLPSVSTNPTATIEWTSQKPNVISNSGMVIQTALVDEEVTLIADITINQVMVSKEITILVQITDHFMLTKEYLSGLIPSEVEKLGLMGLPTEYSNHNATIGWISSNTRRITDAGEVISIGESNINVTLTAVIMIGDETQTATFTVKVLANLDYLFTVAEEYLRYYLKDTTNRDYRLYTTYPNYPSTVTYVSSHPEVLSNDGIYTKANLDTEVDLTVSITIRNETRSFIHKVLVIGLTDMEKVQAISVWIVDYLDELELDSVELLPITHPDHKGVINWFSFDVGVIEKNHQLIQPVITKTTELIIEIRVNFQTMIVNYPITLPGNLNSTDGQLIEEWMLRNTLTDIETVYNLYDGKGIEVNQVFLNPTAPYYLNLTPGLMREVPQETLDAKFYPGYQMPNPENILWIVIHETGNRNNGTGALVHSNLQVNRSLFGFGADATASWHYTVDDKYVYQNIPDYRRAWHAGDGSTAGSGNANGIGIEMAINADGYYEASLRNNAKLVAQLMRKYNLTFANVRQHNYFSGKNCPEIMRGTNRWFEFLDLVAFEYRAMDLLEEAIVSWVVAENDYIKQWNQTTLFHIYNSPIIDQYVDVTLTINTTTFTKIHSFSIRVKGE
jgi:hypothetical protein